MTETETAAKSPIWTDEPFDVHAEDPFDRGSFVATVVGRIQVATADDPSTVFGLVGPWGSGKTSILDRVRSGLADGWQIADFTPWSSGDAASMSLEFVNTVADLLGEKAAGEHRAKLAGYAGFIAPLLGAIPIVGSGAQGTAEHLLDAVGSRPPWHKQFADLSQAIQTLGKRVLIVVDDVDRLGGSELLTLLRVVRLLGRFRGVHYLIAYDQDTVEDLLRSTGSVGRSAAFMEKIVQYPFETPPLPRAAVNRLLNGVLEELLAKTDSHLDHLGLQRATSLVDALAPQLRTPRALGRFREHLDAFADHVSTARLDLLDYVAITWLRLNAHGVWSQLDSWRHELRSGERATSLTETEKLTADIWEGRIAEAHPQADRTGTLDVLSFLFEGVDVRGRRTFIKHSRAMNDPTYFERYLLLAIPEDDVDDELIRIVAAELDPDKFREAATALARVLDGNDDALANLAISRLTVFRENYTTPNLLLLQFLAERMHVRVDEAERVGSPRNGLRPLVAREMALAVLAGETSAPEIIEMLGEAEALNAVWMAPRFAEFRDRRSDLAEGFARFWADRLRSEPGAYIKGGRLGGVAELVTFALEPEETNGLLDPAVTDYDSYIDLAEGFVYAAEWVGSSYTYELQFRKDAFRSLISASTLERYRPQVLEHSGKVEYDVEDHPSRDIPPEIVKAFTVDSLSAL